MGSCCIDTISKHASVRNYTGEPMLQEHIKIILEAARRAPTAWNLMPVHVTAVVDPVKKAKAAEAVGGQDHVRESAVFLVSSLDYDKILRAASRLGVQVAGKGLAHLVEGIIGLGIMAGWAGLAAEGLGYGINYIAVYSNSCSVREAIGLPRELIPLVGITIGRPAELPAPRARQEKVYSIDNETPSLDERAEAVLNLYGERAGRFFRRVLSVEGYVASVEKTVRECLREAGYNI